MTEKFWRVFKVVLLVAVLVYFGLCGLTVYSLVWGVKLPPRVVPGSGAGPTLTPIALTPAELRIKWDWLTEAQKTDYMRELSGQRVRWTCRVSDVYPGGSMSLDCGTGEGRFTPINVDLTLPEKDILNYNKDQVVTFEGQISKITTFLVFTVHIENAIIVE